MEDIKRNAIAYVLIKHFLKKKVGIDNVASLRVECGDIASETGVDVRDVFHVVLSALEEVFDEEINKAKKTKEK